MQNEPMPYRPFAGGYVSDFERFMEAFLDRHPGVEEDRQRGWHIYWDHRVDLDELDKQRQDSVPVKPYSYE